MGSPRPFILGEYASRACSQVIRKQKGMTAMSVNCCASNAGTYTKLPTEDRRIGRQCFGRGSEPVVLVGVTTHQGVWESQTQGEGV
jgi:hypothetical protein